MWAIEFAFTSLAKCERWLILYGIQFGFERGLQDGCGCSYILIANELANLCEHDIANPTQQVPANIERLSNAKMGPSTHQLATCYI